MSSDRRLTTVIPALTLALIAAANIVVGTVALGSFVYAGDLAPYSAQGIRLILLGCCLIALITALASGLRGAVATPPAPLMIVMAGIGAGLALQGDRLFVTMAAITALGALATGLCAALVGWFRLAHLVRFVPYPLACGFVSGTGAVAILVALAQLGVRLEPEALGSLFEPVALSRWGLGVAYGLGLLAATRRWKSPLILPASFAAAVALFHVLLTWFDVSTEAAQSAGLLFAGMAEAPEGALLPLLDPDRLHLVDWVAVAGQAPNILALILVGLLCLVIYLSGLELAGNVELDWNREFRAMGLASMASGLCSGPPRQHRRSHHPAQSPARRRHAAGRRLHRPPRRRGAAVRRRRLLACSAAPDRRRPPVHRRDHAGRVADQGAPQAALAGVRDRRADLPDGHLLRLSGRRWRRDVGARPPADPPARGHGSRESPIHRARPP